MRLFAELRSWARTLKTKVMVVYFAARDPRTPVIARVLALAVAAYALSPIDLIPDVIPVLGYLDDLVIVPLGLALAVRLIPVEVLADAEVRANAIIARPVSRIAAAMIIAVWILALLGTAAWYCGTLGCI